MTLKGKPIWEVRPANTVNTGIHYMPLYQGMVPEYEEREVAKALHLTWVDWCSLDWYERAKGVAHIRLEGLVTLHQKDAVASAEKRMLETSRNGRQHGR